MLDTGGNLTIIYKAVLYIYIPIYAGSEYYSEYKECWNRPHEKYSYDTAFVSVPY
jgi:hypothetical protein